MNAQKRIIILLAVSLIIASLDHFMVRAQTAGTWAPDVRVPGYLDDTFTPILVADQNRAVHALTSQWVSGGDVRRQAVVYRKWALSTGWTRPVDVLLSPSGSALVIGAFLDSKGILHVIFYGGEKSIYYARVQISEASDASAWSLPVEVGPGALGPSHGLITGDNDGNLVILYTGSNDGFGIYAATSSDAGSTWSRPTAVYLTHDNELIPFTVTGSVGKSGKLHVVWNILNFSNEFVFLYYVSLDLANNEWAQPILLAERPQISGFFGPATPVVVDNGKCVVVMYNGGNPFPGQAVGFGRPTLLVNISTDNGESWEVVTNPFPLLTGASGEHSLVIDSNQNIHALALMRIDDSVGGEYRAVAGMWHSELINNDWSNPKRFVTTIRAINVRAVISQGNVLLATWIEESETGDGVWYTYTMLDSPELPVIAFPTLSPQLSVAPAAFTPLAVASATPQDEVLLDNRRAAVYTPAQPLIFGATLVILLLLGTIIAVQLQGRHKK